MICLANSLGKTGFAAVVLAASAAFVPSFAPSIALAQEVAVAAPRLATVSVTGEGRVSAVPDKAELTVGVRHEAATADEALKANSVAMTAVIELLRGAGLTDKDMVTSGLFVSPVWTGHNEEGGPRLTAYSAGNMLNIQVQKIEDLGVILDKVVSGGANDIQGPTFGLKERRSAEDEARKLAVEDARSKATILADSLGMKLGNVASVSMGQHFSGGGAMMRLEAASADAVPVQIGEIEVQASVSVVWELLP